MNQRVKFTTDNVMVGLRIHSAGDVVDVDEETYKRLVKNEKVAADTDDAPTAFPDPPPEPATDPAKSPDGGEGGLVKNKKVKVGE